MRTISPVPSRYLAQSRHSLNFHWEKKKSSRIYTQGNNSDSAKACGRRLSAGAQLKGLSEGRDSDKRFPEEVLKPKEEWRF